MIFFIFLGALILATIIINLGMILAARRYVYSDISSLPQSTAVLVLGSQTHGTRLSPVLQDRVDAGISLMGTGKTGKLLLSGDSGKRAGGSRFYDEVNAMHLYVLENAPGINEEDIFLDHAGLSTWESMYRAKYIFEVNDLIIVTQQFHISRAVTMARSLGINAIGYGIYQGHFRGASLRSWQFREYFARIKGFYSIVFKPPPQIMGDAIPIHGDGRASWL
ncbi:MAG: YdcF family protein [Treponema sp.]|nr:YdcF family protein [Treponema sp.]